MTIERDIEQAFARHSSDVEPSPGEWNALQQRVRRSHRVRVVTFSALGAGAVIAAAVFVPKLVNRPTAAPFVNPGPSTPDSTPTGPPTANIGGPPTIYRDDDARWTLTYDGTWRVSNFEGVTDFYPPKLMAPAAGGPTAAISIQILGEPFDKGAPKNRLNERFAGRDAWVSEENMPTGEHRITYRIDWTGVRCPPGAPCPLPTDGQTTLWAQVYTSSAALWDEWSTVMNAAVKNTLRPTSPIDRTEDFVRTKHGTVDVGMKYDDLTISLVRFLNSRIEQAGADDFFSSNAKKQYDDATNGLGLYGPRGVPDALYTRYEVSQRSDADASSSEFVVRLQWVAGEQKGEVTETLGVGAGRSVSGNESYPVIRFAQKRP